MALVWLDETTGMADLQRWSVWHSNWRPMRVGESRGPSAAFVPRYRSADAVVYVLTLCALCLLASLYAELSLERVLGVQFVVGWFSLDLVWSPESRFVRFDLLVEFAAFALAVAAGIASWWALGESEAFLYFQAISAVVVAAYWIFTEAVTSATRAVDRGCVRALLLYGTVTALAVIVARVQDGVEFIVHPWFVAFVLNALATTRRNSVSPLDRALHGWTWGVLLEAIARDRLVFDRFFYK